MKTSFVAPSETSEQDRFNIPYRIRNADRTEEQINRPVEVHASREEIDGLVSQGFLVRERMFGPEQLARLRNALDEVAAREVEGGMSVSTSPRFGGLFLRHLMDKNPAFLELFNFPPLISIARAVLGPQIQVKAMTARIAYPDQPKQETHWHFHQRVIPDPMPAWFTRPHVLDCLIYLDDVNDANGPLCIVPGSHNRIQEDLPGDVYGELPGQVILRLPAGSVVLLHGALWHRALPTTPQGTVRRLLILPYCAAWLSLPTYGEKPKNGLMQPLADNADAITRELLGEPEGLY